MICWLLMSWNWTMTYLMVTVFTHCPCHWPSHLLWKLTSLQLTSILTLLFFNLYFSFLWQIGLNLLSTDVHFLSCFPHFSFRLTSIYFLQQPFHSSTFPPLAISLFSFKKKKKASSVRLLFPDLKINSNSFSSSSWSPSGHQQPSQISFLSS